MITITLDLQRLTPAAIGAFVGRDIHDYVLLRQELCRALIRNENYQVYLCNELLYLWCADLKDYPPTTVQWIYVDPIREFKDHFRFEPPGGLTAEAIVQLNLLHLPPPAPGQNPTPVAWLLHHYFDPIWGHTEPYAGHAIQLAAWIFGQVPDWLPLALNPLVKEQLRMWSTYAPVYATLASGDLRLTSKHLFLRWALRNYPGAWLREHQLDTTSLIDASSYPDIVRTIIQEQHTALAAYWRNQFVQTSDPKQALGAALAQMSWLSIAELQELIKYLRTEPTLITKALITQLQKLCKDLADSLPLLARLESVVAQDIPTTPNSSWSPEDWRRWVIQEYMPYFIWIMKTKKNRTQQMQLAEQFAHWFYNIYPKMVAEGSSLLITAQFTHLSQAAAENSNAVILWIIIDGLAWWQGQILADLSERAGWFVNNQAAYSALPTITSVAKRVIVTGVVRPPDFRQPIDQLLRSNITRLGAEYTVVDDLEDIVTLVSQNARPGIYAVLYNRLDSHNHEAREFTDNEIIRGDLREISAKVQEIKEHCDQHGRKLQVFIGTDHGSTRLPDNAPHPILPATTHNWTDRVEEEESMNAAAPERRTRTAYWNSNIAQSFPNSIAQEWFVLDPVSYGLNSTYIVPHGYGYVSRKPSGWTHGGLTPEEVVVPLMQLTIEHPEILDLSIFIKGTLLPKKAVALTVHIINPNPFPLEEIRVEFGTNAQPFQLPQLPASKTHTQELEFAPAISLGDNQSIGWTITYHLFGRPRSQAGTTAIAIRRLQQTSDFDEMFED